MLVLMAVLCGALRVALRVPRGALRVPPRTRVRPLRCQPEESATESYAACSAYWAEVGEAWQPFLEMMDVRWAVDAGEIEASQGLDDTVVRYRDMDAERLYPRWQGLWRAGKQWDQRVAKYDRTRQEPRAVLVDAERWERGVRLGAEKQFRTDFVWEPGFPLWSPPDKGDALGDLLAAGATSETRYMTSQLVQSVLKEVDDNTFAAVRSAYKSSLEAKGLDPAAELATLKRKFGVVEEDDDKAWEEITDQVLGTGVRAAVGAAGATVVFSLVLFVGALNLLGFVGHALFEPLFNALTSRDVVSTVSSPPTSPAGINAAMDAFLNKQ